MSAPIISVAPIATYLPILHPITTMHCSPTEPSVVLDLSRKQSPAYSCDYGYTQTNLELCTSPKSLSGQSESSELSIADSKDLNSNYGSVKCKQSRPFKAYLKDPLSMTLGTVTDNLMGKDSSEAYANFRYKMLSQVHSTQNGTNKNMRRNQSQNTIIEDPSYWEKRKKNNEAAKRSRDARRVKEDEIAIRCAFLEQENMQLKFRLANLESERQRLQKLLYP